MNLQERKVSGITGHTLEVPEIPPEDESKQRFEEYPFISANIVSRTQSRYMLTHTI